MTRKIAAFTLVELLTVVAVIGTLAAIIIPTVSGARQAADRAKTKAQFSQWAAALELYRQEYGRYPAVTTGGLIDTANFAEALTGHTLAGGTPVGDLNPKGIAFYALATDELDEAGDVLVDAFGNTAIALRFDTNRDGLINGFDTGSWVAVAGAEGGSFAPTDATGAVPTQGVRARVVIYSAGLGRTAEDMILSWR